MSDPFGFFEPENDDDIPSEWDKNPPWQNDPDLDDLIRIMRPRELEYWNEGGQSHSERQEFLARIDARWRRWKDVAWQRAGRKPERPGIDLTGMLRKILENAPPFEAKAQSEPAKPPKARRTSIKTSLDTLHDEVDRAGNVVSEAAEALRRRNPKEREYNEQPPLAEKASWPKVAVGVLLAFLGFYFAIASAYQNAGVQSVWVAHSMIAAGWLFFMLSIGFADYYLPLAKRTRIRLALTVGFASLIFAICADVMMVKLKAQQQPQVQSTSSPTVSDRVPPTVAPSSSGTTDERTPLDIAPEKLLDLFDKYNEAQAAGLVQPYIGRWLEIQGKVMEVSRDLAPLREDTRTVKNAIKVVLGTKRKDKPKVNLVIQAIFEDQRWMDRATVLKHNEDIKVRGQIRYVFAFGFYLERCEIIE